ncbi:hypothetical protein ACQ3I4_08535 [Zafaria sp. Z1313]|uniref:hypothetical protein n=1 Tax=Zafaria sp. Z1313 TaxID=3423202 RepID=UPI003D30182A
MERNDGGPRRAWGVAAACVAAGGGLLHVVLWMHGALAPDPGYVFHAGPSGHGWMLVTYVLTAAAAVGMLALGGTFTEGARIDPAACALEGDASGLLLVCGEESIAIPPEG